jgi:hypothetical protein
LLFATWAKSCGNSEGDNGDDVQVSRVNESTQLRLTNGSARWSSETEHGRYSSSITQCQVFHDGRPVPARQLDLLLTAFVYAHHVFLCLSLIRAACFP